MSNVTKVKESPNITDEMLAQLTEGLSTEEDIFGREGLFRQLQKRILERMLNKEMELHLASERPSAGSKNYRNGKGHKTLRSDSGEIPLDTPRDRNSTFEPMIIPKRSRSIGMLDDAIMALYSKGMTTRDIQSTVKELYGVEVSHTLVSEVTQAVMADVQEWQNRPLDKIYPIVWLDAIAVKVHKDSRVLSMNIHIALGVNISGRKEILGMWISETEGAKFWAQVLSEISSRGVKDVFVFCVDGLTGFPQAIKGVFPNADIQLCLVHMMRQSLAAVPDKDRKAVSADLKKVYHAPSEEAARNALDEFTTKWDSKYPSISRKWRLHWENLITIFKYPHDIRKVIYTTNSIESLNMVIRKGIRGRRIMPSEESALKLVWLAAAEASKRWTMPIRDWPAALNFFLILFEDRIQNVA
ncbi:MAG: IS256 family transposase [Synergistaceae bacterium]|nr:IS256 family transposase [Synergistaceae bacterium]